MLHKSRFGPGAAHFRIGRKADAADLHLIDGAFTTHMREHGYAVAAIVQYHAMRYQSVRNLARYLVALDPRTEVPPARLLGSTWVRRQRSLHNAELGIMK